MVRNRFRGSSDHVLDNKGRLNFPARFRDVLRNRESEILILAPWKRYLRVYPVADWEVLEEKIWKEGPTEDLDPSFVRYLMRNLEECTLDKQGRIRIPQHLKQAIGLHKQVTLSGMRNWVEIWDRDALLADNAKAEENFEKYENQVRKLGSY